jgi:hypothetical protein
MKRNQKHQGLLENRELTKQQNTEALWSQVQRMRKEKPDVHWRLKEIWSGAGLKSDVALKSPWNAHIREAIDEHNRQIEEERDLGPLGRSQRKTVRAVNRELKAQLEQAKADLDAVLSQIAIWEAEVAFYKKENDRLMRKIERLSGS